MGVRGWVSLNFSIHPPPPSISCSSTSTMGSLRSRLAGMRELLGWGRQWTPPSPEGQPDGVLRGTHNYNVGATKSASREWTRTQPRRAGAERAGQGQAAILTARAGAEAQAEEHRQQHYQARQHPGHAASSGAGAGAGAEAGAGAGAGARLRASTSGSAALPLKAGAGGLSRPRLAGLTSGAGPQEAPPPEAERPRAGAGPGAHCPALATAPRGWGRCRDPAGAGPSRAGGGVLTNPSLPASKAPTL